MIRHYFLFSLILLGLSVGAGIARGANECPTPTSPKPGKNEMDCPYWLVNGCRWEDAGYGNYEDACGNPVCEVEEEGTYPYTDVCGNPSCRAPEDGDECCEDETIAGSGQVCCPSGNETTATDFDKCCDIGGRAGDGQVCCGPTGQTEAVDIALCCGVLNDHLLQPDEECCDDGSVAGEGQVCCGPIGQKKAVDEALCCGELNEYLLKTGEVCCDDDSVARTGQVCCGPTGQTRAVKETNCCEGLERPKAPDGSVCIDGPSYTVSPTGGVGPYDSFISSRTDIAEVDSTTGVVTGGDFEGTSTISFKDSKGCVGTAKVTAFKEPDSPDKNILCIGELLDLAQADFEITYSIADETILSRHSVTAVKGLRPGTTTVTIKRVGATCSINVPITVNPSPTVIITSPASGTTFTAGEQITLVAQVSPAGSGTYVWVGADDSQSGTATVTYSTPGFKLVSVTYIDSENCKSLDSTFVHLNIVAPAGSGSSGGSGLFRPRAGEAQHGFDAYTEALPWTSVSAGEESSVLGFSLLSGNHANVVFSVPLGANSIIENVNASGFLTSSRTGGSIVQAAGAFTNVPIYAKAQSNSTVLGPWVAEVVASMQDGNGNLSEMARIKVCVFRKQQFTVHLFKVVDASYDHDPVRNPNDVNPTDFTVMPTMSQLVGTLNSVYQQAGIAFVAGDNAAAISVNSDYDANGDGLLNGDDGVEPTEWKKMQADMNAYIATHYTVDQRKHDYFITIYRKSGNPVTTGPRKSDGSVYYQRGGNLGADGYAYGPFLESVGFADEEEVAAAAGHEIGHGLGLAFSDYEEFSPRTLVGVVYPPTNNGGVDTTSDHDNFSFPNPEVGSSGMLWSFMRAGLFNGQVIQLDTNSRSLRKIYWEQVNFKARIKKNL